MKNHTSRKETAKRLLEEQLKRNTKPEKINGKSTGNLIPLTDEDIKRIKRELTALANPKK